MEVFETIDLRKSKENLLKKFYDTQQERMKLKEVRKSMNQDLTSIKTELIRRNKILREFDDNDLQEIKFIYDNGTLDGYEKDTEAIDKLKDEVQEVGRDYKSKTEEVDNITFEIEDLKKEELKLSKQITFIKRKIDILKTYDGKKQVDLNTEVVIKCEIKDEHREEVIIESRYHNVQELTETIKRTTFIKINDKWYQQKPKSTSQVKKERNEELNQLLLLYKKTNN